MTLRFFSSSQITNMIITYVMRIVTKVTINFYNSNKKHIEHITL